MTGKHQQLIQETMENMSKLKHLAIDRANLDTIGLSKAQVELLYSVSHRPGSTAKQVALATGVSKSAVAQILDPLAKEQLIERRVDDNDRRVVHLFITSKGQKKLDIIKKNLMECMRGAMETLSENELQTLNDLHRKMIMKVLKKKGIN